MLNTQIAHILPLLERLHFRSTRQFTLTLRPRIILLIYSRYFTNHDPGYSYYSTVNGMIPPACKYNRTGRGFPVSTISYNASLIIGGEFDMKGGTSMAACSCIHINSHQRKAPCRRQIPSRIVNPTLYANPEMFNDITIGNQSLGDPCAGNGFYCVPGWDPVTGLGAPKYNEWLEVFMTLP
jgi:tripeptidyl-peptidase-1